MGINLQREALEAALELAPADIGVAVWPQMVSAKPATGNGRSGLVPVWHMLLTIANPADLTGQRLRTYAPVGYGAPDHGMIRQAVPEHVASLRELARRKLAEAGN